MTIQTKRTQTLVDNFFAGKISGAELKALRDIADDANDQKELRAVADAISDIIRMQRQGFKISK